MSSGRFITFEGGEGAGKTTQIARLQQDLKAAGHDVIITREPGGSIGAEAIRALLVSGAPDRWSATTETLLNYAARASHLEETIRPALAAGKIVLCDRFMDSTTAYQGVAGGADLDLIATLAQKVVGNDKPDLTLIFDLDPEQGLARTTTRETRNEDRYEKKSLDYHKKLRAAFLQIAENEPQRCLIIDAAGSAEQVYQRVHSAVTDRLGLS